MPVGDRSFVGSLGLLGDLALDDSALLAVEGVVVAGAASGMAGFEFDRADLLGERRGEREA